MVPTVFEPLKFYYNCMMGVREARGCVGKEDGETRLDELIVIYYFHRKSDIRCTF